MSAIILTTVWWVTGYYLVIYLAGLGHPPRPLRGGRARRRLRLARFGRSRCRCSARCCSSWSSPTSSARSSSSARCSSSPAAAGRRHPHRGPAPVRTAFQNFFQFGAASRDGLGALRGRSSRFSVLQFRLLRGHGVWYRAPRRAGPSTARAWPRGGAPRPGRALALADRVGSCVDLAQAAPDVVRLPPSRSPWPATAPLRRGAAAASSADRARRARLRRRRGRGRWETVVRRLAQRDGRPTRSARMRFPRTRSVFVLLVGSLMCPNTVRPGPAVRAHPAAGPAQHLPGLIVPEAAMTFAVRRLPPAAVLRDDAAGAGGCRPRSTAPTPGQVFSRLHRAALA